MSYRTFFQKISLEIHPVLRAGLVGPVVALSVAAGALPARAAGRLPYADAGAKGVVGLCDRAGKPLRGGALRDKPFAWTAVSSERAPAPYDRATRTATLFAFQPRRDIPPEEWSGSMLTASSKYTNAAHPIAQATNADWSLADFLSVYPATWDGLVQLRIYLGAADQPLRQQEYATADIQVTGDRWELVEGGDGPCNAGKAVSLETTLLPADFFSDPPSDPGAAPGTPGQAGTGSSGQPAGPDGNKAPAAGAGGRGAGGGTAGTGAPSGGQGPAAAADPSRRTSATGPSGDGSGSTVTLVAAGVVALAAGGLLWARSRRRRTARGVGE